MLDRGTSVAFFPEGTRSKDGKLHAFKRVSLAGREGVWRCSGPAFHG